MIRAVLLDNDGVLVDTERCFYEANRVLFKELGVGFSAGIFADNVLKEARGLLYLLEARGFSDEEIVDLRRRRDELYVSYIDQWEIAIPGVEAGLTRLKQACGLCLVTSSLRENIERMHARTGFMRFFDGVVSAEDCRVMKPDPAPFLAALDKMRVGPDEAVAVEDCERGLKSAHAAGVRCIVVPNELTRSQSFEKAWHVADTFTAAVDIIMAAAAS